jgi:ADP-ribosylglycohydrolase
VVLFFFVAAAACGAVAARRTAATTTTVHCGGDNCHRGAVVGALLGLANGIPEKWLAQLKKRA